jgi:hypothetical protein
MDPSGFCVDALPGTLPPQFSVVRARGTQVYYLTRDATTERAVHFDTTTNAVTTSQPIARLFNDVFTNCVADDSMGNVWVGLGTRGNIRFSDTRLPEIFDAGVDSMGVAAWNGGLYRLTRYGKLRHSDTSIPVLEPYEHHVQAESNTKAVGDGGAYMRFIGVDALNEYAAITISLGMPLAGAPAEPPSQSEVPLVGLADFAVNADSTAVAYLARGDAGNTQKIIITRASGNAMITPQTYVLAMEYDSNGQLWLGSGNAPKLEVVSAGGGITEIALPTAAGSVFSLARLANGVMVVSTQNAGLFKIRPHGI